MFDHLPLLFSNRHCKRNPWPIVRDAIRLKLERILKDLETEAAPIATDVPRAINPDANPLPPPATTSLPTSLLPIEDLEESTLEVPPQPPHQNLSIGPHGETLVEFEVRLFGALDCFNDLPPFTIQRLCELLTFHSKQYTSSQWKYLAALEKVLSVTSPFLDPPGPEGGISTDEANGTVNGIAEDHTRNLIPGAQEGQHEERETGNGFGGGPTQPELEGWDGLRSQPPASQRSSLETSEAGSRLDWSTVADDDDEHGPTMDELLNMGDDEPPLENSESGSTQRNLEERGVIKDEEKMDLT
ncbi:hypothetical protein HDU93_004123 [Gonapodya sp. JEL0774]|nr:hypothetical protein HDU93_004123 [Gonapodya sp. JEL0774]